MLHIHAHLNQSLLKVQENPATRYIVKDSLIQSNFAFRLHFAFSLAPMSIAPSLNVVMTFGIRAWDLK